MAVATLTSTTSQPQPPMDSKRNSSVKSEDKLVKESSHKEPNKVELSTDKSESTAKADPVAQSSVKQETKPAVSDSEATQPLAPPPRPQQTNGDNPDYFTSQHKNHLSYEPNPFEQSFGNPSAETPGKSLLPPVASLTSPAPLTGNTSLGRGFDWNGSLRSGPLSPAMLSGPTGGDYFDSIRSFPTPNESSLRTGLTPGGGGSMFPAPSPGSQAFLNSLASGGATPSTLDFQRAAVNAAAATKGESFTSPTTTQPPATKAQTAAMEQPTAHQGFGQHDNDAANGLYLLAQAGNESQANNQFAVPSAPANTNGMDASNARSTRSNGGSIGGSISAASGREHDDAGSEGDKQPATRKSKRANAGKNNSNRRKADESLPKQPTSKKAKANNGPAMDISGDEEDSEDDAKESKNGDNKKMTDEEKRKNFLERNRVAALKCRQRKKQWLQNLQNKVEIFSSENDALNSQVAQLRDEILNLKTILIAHKDCPIAQQQAQAGAYLQHGVDYSNAPNPYTMGMQPQQPVGIAGPRRFS